MSYELFYNSLTFKVGYKSQIQVQVQVKSKSKSRAWTWTWLAIRFCRMTWTWLGLAITTWWLGNDLPSIFHATWRLGLWLAINFSRDLTTWTVTCHQLFIINQIHSLIRIYASLFDIRLSFYLSIYLKR